jgi:hypothetical protein
MEPGPSNRWDGEEAAEAARRLGQRLQWLVGTLKMQAAEIKDHAAYLASAKLDKIKASARNGVIYGALAITVLTAGATFLIMSVVMVCIGFAWGMTAVFGGNAWLGWLVAGAILLIFLMTMVFAGAMLAMGMLKRGTFKKYRQWQARQRGRFGYDVHERAVAQAAGE